MSTCTCTNVLHKVICAELTADVEVDVVWRGSRLTVDAVDGYALVAAVVRRSDVMDLQVPAWHDHVTL